MDDRPDNPECSPLFTLGSAQMRYIFNAPGTYFFSVRVTANCSDDPYTAVQNIDRMRVVVS